MTDIKQFKLTNNDEIICQVLQYDDADNAAMVVRGTMRIIAAEDYTRGIRFYAFRPWMGFTDGPNELHTLNAVHIIGEMNPSDTLIDNYLQTIATVKKQFKKKDMPLDDIAQKVENMEEDEFNDFLDKYLKENQVDLFDPEELNLDSDKGSNIIKFKPKGTMH